MEDFTKSSDQSIGQPTPKPSGGPTGQNLGIAALITAIVTFVLAVIPCVGIIAMIPGIIAIILAAVGLSQASSGNHPRGVLIAGLIIAVVAVCISFSQIFIAGKIGDKFEKRWGGEIENIIDDVQKNVLDELEDANVSIKIENGDEKTEINIRAGKSDQIQELEELEKGNTGTNDTIEKKE
jgi:mannose/fructose/N-acetylgalactosamine-specific phosphotransferase system component IID